MKKIKVIITLDKNNGLFFNHRRQSRDRFLIDDMCKKVDGKIYVNEYSASLFNEHYDKITIATDPIFECPDGGYAFVEGTQISPYLDQIDEIIVYSWNTLYPSDMKLDFDINASGFKMSAKYDFKGFSHDKITKGTYKK